LKKSDSEGIGEYLIADVKGPGAIVRLWTAAISGTIKMYINNLSVPVYDGPADEYFHSVYNHFREIRNINRERFEKTIYQRDACYAPVSFAERLRVVWKGKLEDIHFYQMQVRLYEKNAVVISFSTSDITKYSHTINQVTRVLSDPDSYLPVRSDKSASLFNVRVSPSENVNAISLTGPQAIERLTLRVKAANMKQALRQTVLHIICDDYSWGQVQSPIGDFFGAAPGINPYQSLPFTVRPDGSMICRYVMPFEKSLKTIIENKGEQAVEVEGSVLTMPFDWNDRAMHFRARWRVNHNMLASNETVQDLLFLLAVGKGVYVGTTSFIMNPNQIPTPWGNWWGEGDEKVPSIFGTGSEDYYNYSWSSPDIFYYPYCGQPRNDEPGNRGFVTNYRWQIFDPIPFRENIRFYMELFSHEPTPGLSYARIGYHYAVQGTTDDHIVIMPEDVRHPELPETWHPAARFGTRNSTFYKAEDAVVTKVNTKMKKGKLWADGEMLVWKPEKSGDEINFTFEIFETGEKRINLVAALNNNAGKISIKLDNKPLHSNGTDNSVDLYRPYRELSRSYYLGTEELNPGKHTVICIFEGAESTVVNPEIGLDFFWIQRIED